MKRARLLSGFERGGVEVPDRTGIAFRRFRCPRSDMDDRPQMRISGRASPPSFDTNFAPSMTGLVSPIMDG